MQPTLDSVTLAVRDSRIIGRDVDRFDLSGMLRAMVPESAPSRGGTWDIGTQQAHVVDDRICRLRDYETDRPSGRRLVPEWVTLAVFVFVLGAVALRSLFALLRWWRHELDS